MNERMRGKKIGGGLGEITVNGATKGFPGVPGFLRVRPSIRSQSNQDSQLFNGAAAGQTSDSCLLFFLVIHLSSSLVCGLRVCHLPSSIRQHVPLKRLFFFFFSHRTTLAKSELCDLIALAAMWNRRNDDKLFRRNSRQRSCRIG